MLVVPAVSDGSNNNGLSQGLPFGPLVMSNVEEDSAGGLPDHGAIVAVVV
jgi:hypothetical protein